MYLKPRRGDSNLAKGTSDLLREPRVLALLEMTMKEISPIVEMTKKLLLDNC